uniref:Cytochrome c biogenesis protein CcsA n=1 Tax=Viscum crassulae TaxID=1522199 RepID=A0A0M4FGI4_9MAGN|nr:c-type cytochrome synthesis protein [Viscum crassulae]ALC75152.1 c-type cytochrome synthesis protein [Viscum crassulae]
MIIFSIFDQLLNHISFSIVSILILIYLINYLVDEIELYNSSERGIIATFICITGLLITRWIDSNHLPLNDLSESLLFLSWNLSVLHMYFYFKNNYYSEITKLGIILTQGFVSSELLTEINYKSLKLVPALQSHWLMMHVSMILFGYAALLFGSLFSVALLVITFQQMIRGFLCKISFLSILYFVGKIKKKKRRVGNFLQQTYFFSINNYYRYQFIQRLDYWSYRLILIGYIFLTIGIISGSVWANEVWGSYWNWDPKETWSLITWTVYTVYLHTKKNKNSAGKNSAIMASMGFLMIWICYFGVNLLEIGMHSYGSFE